MVASRFLFCGHDGQSIEFFNKGIISRTGKVGWTHTVLALFISYPILWFLTESKKYICIQKIESLVRGRYPIYFYFEKSESLYVIGPSVALTGLVSIFLFRKEKSLISS